MKKTFNPSFSKTLALIFPIIFLAITVFLFTSIKESNVERAENDIKSYISSWNYTFTEDLLYKKDINLASKVAHRLRAFPISSYEFTVQSKKVLSWPQQKTALSSNCHLPVKKSLILPLGIKMGMVTVCLSEARIIRETLFSPLFVITTVIMILFILFSGMTSILSYKRSLNQTILELQALRKNPKNKFLKLYSHDKTVNQVIDLLNKVIGTQLQLTDAQYELKTQRAFTNLTRQVAHDVRSPALALERILKTQNFLIKSKISPKTHELIQSAIQSIMETSNDLLDQTKKEYQYNNSRIEDIAPLVQSVITQKEILNPNIDFEFNSPTKILAQCHPSEFKRIISNLINNSIESLPKNKKGVISCCIQSELNSKLPKYKIVITDKGRGIKSEVLNKVSKKGFSSGKNKGNGLGLSYASERVQIWGGSLEIESQENKGTSVTIKLLADAQQKTLDSNDKTLDNIKYLDPLKEISS